MAITRSKKIAPLPSTGSRIVVAMSGGVDSSVVAALLKRKGYDVVGVTLQLYDHGKAIQKKGACCAGQDIHDAKRVAEMLNIPHYVLNYENRFRDEVMEDFADTYLAGETPIPCVKCNQSVKFRDLLTTAKDLGAEFMATGHYVQRLEKNGHTELHRGADPTKDQSYFLFATTQEQLDFLRFPLGHLQKEETRSLAAEFGLSVQNKPDSQDICFVPTGGYAKVIERLRPGALESGNIVHLDGRVLGTHDGIINYTIGQRRGLGVSDKTPLYVIKLNTETNEVIVGPENALLKDSLTIRDVNWLGTTPLSNTPIPATAKLRSTQPGTAATVTASASNPQQAIVHLQEPQAGIAPGQACVLYTGDRVLGGGWIMRD